MVPPPAPSEVEVVDSVSVTGLPGPDPDEPEPDDPEPDGPAPEVAEVPDGAALAVLVPLGAVEAPEPVAAAGVLLDEPQPLVANKIAVSPAATEILDPGISMDDLPLRAF